jgi:probable F420-dependent oxidoreductase
LKFGVYLYPPGGVADPEHVVRLAQAAERLAFDSVWLGDHVAWPLEFDPAPHSSDVGGRTPPPAVVHTAVLEPFTTFAYLAASVHRVKLGIGVLIAAYRNPLLAAKMLAMLDQLSHGRLVVGVGAGWLREEFPALGAPPFPHRGSVADEYIQAFIELWTSDEPRFQGRFAHIAGVVLNPKPVQKPHPPVWVGGNGLAAMRRAAALAAGWMPLHQDPDQLAVKIRTARSLLEDNHRSAAGFRFATGCRFRFQDAPGEAGLIGPPEELADRLGRYREAGVDEVYLINDGYATLDALVEAWERFIDRVAPKA